MDLFVALDFGIFLLFSIKKKLHKNSLKIPTVFHKTLKIRPRTAFCKALLSTG